MISRYRIGNAQTIGCREVQSNYFSTVYDDTGDLFAVLADGTIDHPNGRRAAILAVEYCVDSFMLSAPQSRTEQFFLEVAQKANRHVQGMIYTEKSPRLSLSMILFTGKELQYFNVGANKLYLYDRHNERVIGNSLNRPYASGRCELAAKNVIAILSAGAHIDAHAMERLRIMESKKNVFDKAQAIIEAVKSKGLNNQMNATALLVEVV